MEEVCPSHLDFINICVDQRDAQPSYRCYWDWEEDLLKSALHLWWCARHCKNEDCTLRRDQGLEISGVLLQNKAWLQKQLNIRLRNVYQRCNFTKSHSTSRQYKIYMHTFQNNILLSLLSCLASSAHCYGTPMSISCKLSRQTETVLKSLVCYITKTRHINRNIFAPMCLSSDNIG